jgi:hypothetical protein
VFETKQNNVATRRKYYVVDEFDDTYYGAPVSWSAGVSVEF